MARFNLESNIQEQSSLFEAFGGTIGRLPGLFRSAIQSVKALTTAIAANPVGLVLVAIAAAIGLVTAAFSRFQPVIDVFNQGIAAARAAMDFFLDTIIEVVTGQELTTMSFLDTVAAAAELEAATQRLADAQLESLVPQAERNAQLQEFRLIAADATLSEQERIDAFTQAEVVQRQIFATERALATERLRILQEQQALGNNTREDNEEAAQLQADLINLTARENAALREIAGTRSGLIRTANMKAEADLKEAAALREKNIQLETEAELTRNKIRENDLTIEQQIQIANGTLTEAEALDQLVNAADDRISSINAELTSLGEIRQTRALTSEEEDRLASLRIQQTEALMTSDQLFLRQTLTNAETQQTNLENVANARVRAVTQELEIAEAQGASVEELAELRQTAFEVRLDEISTIADASERAAAEEEARHQNRLEMIQAEMDAEIAKTETTQKTTDATIAAVSGVGDALTTIAGENKGLAIAGLIVEQAAGIASITVNTLRAIAEAAPNIPQQIAIGVQGAASVVAAIAATAQGIDAINSAPGPAASGVAGGGGASSIPFGPTVSQPATAQQPSQADQQNAQASALTQAMQDATIVAVTADGDINNSTERNQRTRSRRRLGRNSG